MKSTNVIDTVEDLDHVDARYNELLCKLGEDPNAGFWANIAKESGALTVLEMGCGAGNASIPLARQGFEVTAVDANPVLIDLLRSAGHKGLIPVCERFERLSLGTRFEFVFLPSLLFNLVGVETRREFLACAVRHLIGGRLFATEIFRPDWLRALSTFESQKQRIVVERGDEPDTYTVTGTYFFPDTTYRHVMSARVLTPCAVESYAMEHGLNLIEVRRRNPITDVLLFRGKG
jgi:SAM-dependent methyltransferase